MSVTILTPQIVLDIETMGIQSDAAIVAIAAVAFTILDGEFNLLDDFDETVDLKSAVQAGGTIDPDAVMWWIEQPEEVRSQLLNGTDSIKSVLARFSGFIFNNYTKSTAEVWGNGVDFDNVILASAYRRSEIPVPWNFRQNRCFRTLKNLYSQVPEPVFIGTKHTALDDARHEALWLKNILVAIEQGKQSHVP